MPYKIAICDDNLIDTQYIQNLITQWAEDHARPVQIHTFPSAESFLFRYAEEKDFHLLLLDIEMKGADGTGMDGVTLARKIRLENESVQLIFITGYPDYVDQGYEVSALHYLRKPVQIEKLFQTLERAYKANSKKKKALFLPLEGESIRIPVEDIQYLEVFDHRIDLVLVSVTYSVKLPLRELEKQLTEDFVRLNRSCIANLRFIKRITKTECTLDSGITLPISRRAYPDVNRAMIHYVTGGIRP